MKSRLLLSAALTAVVLAGTPSLANDVSGTWLRDTGASQVKFGPCGGGALCGNIAWIKPGADTKGKVGQRVFYDMKPDGSGGWKGSAFNPEDGQNYTGKMSLSGGTLTTQGCAAGGLICRSTTWTRAN